MKRAKSMTQIQGYASVLAALSLMMAIFPGPPWAKGVILKSPPQISPREPTAEGYENTHMPFTRKFLGDELREFWDPAGMLDEQGPVTNLMEEVTGENIPSPGAVIGDQLQKVIGEHDMSDEEVLQYVAKNRPNVQHLVDMDSLKESMEDINEYYKRRLTQRQRKEAHETYFPELRTYLEATVESPKVRKNIMEMSDEQLTREYARRVYKNQELPPLAGIIDDMISDGKQQFQEIKDESENIVTASSPEELSKKANQLEEYNEVAKKDDESPEMLVHYRDEDTGADLLFASPERIDQYFHERRWRTLGFIDRGAVSEWMVGAAGRAAVLWASAAAGAVRSGAWLVGKALGTGPVLAIRQIEGIQGALEAIRRKSSIRISDDEGDDIFLIGQQGEGKFGVGVFGEGFNAVNLAGRFGEAFGSGVPGAYFGATLAQIGRSTRRIGTLSQGPI